MYPVLPGIDLLLAHPPAWRTAAIALVTNHAATTAGFQPARQALLQAGFNVVKLFSPEHGLDTTGADGHRIDDGRDPLTGLPVVSLYGHRLAPGPDELAGIDLVLFDIPDIGCRFYTYLWTMTHVMEACAAAGLPLVMADRPNPLSGRFDLCEGPLLDEAHCSSFIGRWSIPVRHSCTLGELALYFNATRGIGCSLEVIPCSGWRRELFYHQCFPSFVPLSPAIPAFESALLYGGLCFLEATNISEGRGTAAPFRMAGAPWMEAAAAASLFNQTTAAENIVQARPVTFTPAEGKYAAQKCNGIMLHAGDTASFRPVAAGWRLLRIVKELHPAHFAWAPYPTHVNTSGKRHLDLLAGLPDAEQIFDKPLPEFANEIKYYTDTGSWRERAAPFLLYE